MAQILQLAGAVMILLAFVLTQLEKMSPNAYPGLLLNLIGSAILAGLALTGRQWGFLLLEGVWALVSAWGLVRRLLERGRTR